MKKLINFLKESNRWKHLTGGVAIYSVGRTVSNEEGALFATYASAFSLELKDKQWGGKPDIIDILCTVALPTVAYIIEKIIKITTE